MKTEVRSAYRCFRRVQEFLAAYNVMEGRATLGKPLTELNEVVEGPSRESLDQEAGARLTKACTAHQREFAYATLAAAHAAHRGRVA